MFNKLAISKCWPVGLHLLLDMNQATSMESSRTPKVFSTYGIRLKNRASEITSLIRKQISEAHGCNQLRRKGRVPLVLAREG